MSSDVVRFMFENKISTATMGGHGFGAKLALAVGCYHADRVTGMANLFTAANCMSFKVFSVSILHQWTRDTMNLSMNSSVTLIFYPESISKLKRPTLKRPSPKKST